MKVRSRTRGLSRILPLQLWGFRGASFVFVVAGFSLYGLSLANPSTLQSVRVMMTDMAAPCVDAVHRPVQAAADYIGAVSGIAQLQDEVIALRQENARLREWHNAALALKSENERLTDLLKLKVPEPHGFISARVISDAGNSFAKSVLVMAGERDGIVKGQAVISGDGLIGRVVEGGEKASRVLLLTDINSRVPVTIDGSGGTRAILAGQNHDFPRLDHLPPEHKIETGQRVVTSGHGGLFLPGLPVGLTYVDDEGQVFVRLFARLDQLVYVRMIDRVTDEAILQGKIRSASPR